MFDLCKIFYSLLSCNLVFLRKIRLHKFARANMVPKSAKKEEIEDKGSKYRIYIPVYMELHIWEQMQYLLSLPLMSSSFALFLHVISTEWICWKSKISRSGPIYCHMFIFILAYVYLYTVICLSLYRHMFIFILAYVYLCTETSMQ